MGTCPECGADDWNEGELVITTSMLLGAKTSYMLNFKSNDNKKRKKVKAKQCKNCDHINIYASS
jgi:predicted nucleic-acid-binding Zn-ribbon protein